MVASNAASKYRRGPTGCAMQIHFNPVDFKQDLKVSELQC